MCVAWPSKWRGCGTRARVAHRGHGRERRTGVWNTAGRPGTNRGQLSTGEYLATTPSDIAIAKAAKLRPFADVAAEVGLGPADLLPYGHTKAKIAPEAIAGRPSGRLVLVTGISPTPAGEGKSTCTIGVAMALRPWARRWSWPSGSPPRAPCSE